MAAGLRCVAVEQEIREAAPGSAAASGRRRARRRIRYGSHQEGGCGGRAGRPRGKRPSEPLSVNGFQFSMLPAHSRAQHSKCQIGVGQQLDVSAIPAKLPYQPVPGASAGPDRSGRPRRRVHVAGCDGQTLPRRDLEPDADGPPAVGRVGGGREQDRDRSHPGQAEEDPGAAQPPPLPDGAAEKIAAILREAEARSSNR